MKGIFYFKFNRFIEKDLARNIFPKRNYYDFEYFEYLHYFNYKYFKQIIAKLSKTNNEEKKEMIKIKNILVDFRKINEKFNVMRHTLKYLPKKNLMTVNHIFTTLNSVFAHLDVNFEEAHTKQLFKKLINQNPVKSSEKSTFQNQDLGKESTAVRKV